MSESTQGGVDSLNDASSFVLSSDHRLATVEVLAEGDATPTGVAESTGLRITHASRALRQLRDRGIVELLVDEDVQQGRIYGLTELGERVIGRIDDVNTGGDDGGD